MPPTDAILDCAIIGAGASGLACARLLHDSQKKVAVFEARNRLGGRTFTEDATRLELGAEFIHGENATTHELAKRAGLRVVGAERYPRLKYGAPGPARQISELDGDLKMRWIKAKELYNSLEHLAPDPDVSLRSFLSSSLGPSFDSALDTMCDVLLAQTWCAPLSDLSCADLNREMRVDKAGPREFRIDEGYSALWNFYAKDLDIRLGSTVNRVVWSNDSESGVMLADGSFIRAKSIVVTIPVAVLSRNLSLFSPALPESTQSAIKTFKTMGGTKLIYTFNRLVWYAKESYICGPGICPRWWFPFENRTGPATACCFITADRAAVIDALSDTEARDIGLSELARLLDVPVGILSANLTSFRRISWAHDPLALGAYAYTPPNGLWARDELAKSIQNLFFAGEATAVETNVQTVHGALESGWRAARQVIEGLK